MAMPVGMVVPLTLVGVALVAFFATVLVAFIAMPFLLMVVVVAMVVTVVVVAMVVVVGALHRGDLELLVPGGLPRIGPYLPLVDHGLFVYHTGHFVVWWDSEMVRRFGSEVGLVG
jgi:hypothetical protein